jgi:hypothetical protein
VAQSHTPRNCCVRFVFGVAAASRNTRFQAARYGLTWAGLAPAGSHGFLQAVTECRYPVNSIGSRGGIQEADPGIDGRCCAFAASGHIATAPPDELASLSADQTACASAPALRRIAEYPFRGGHRML